MIDYTHILKDAGLVASSAAATVGGEAEIVDLGAAKVEGHFVVDVSAIEVDSGNELYKIALQGSNQSNFAGVSGECAVLNLGANAVIDRGADSGTGRYVMPFQTEQNGEVWQYVRAYTTVSGTVGTGINYAAYLAK